MIHTSAYSLIKWKSWRERGTVIIETRYFWLRSNSQADWFFVLSRLRNKSCLVLTHTLIIKLMISLCQMNLITVSHLSGALAGTIAQSVKTAPSKLHRWRTKQQLLSSSLVITLYLITLLSFSLSVWWLCKLHEWYANSLHARRAFEWKWNKRIMFLSVESVSVSWHNSISMTRVEKPHRWVDHLFCCAATLMMSRADMLHRL